MKDLAIDGTISIVTLRRKTESRVGEKMKKELYVSKFTMSLIMGGLFLAALLILFFFIRDKNRLAEVSEDYTYITARVCDVKEYERETSDDDKYYTYMITVKYRVDGENYLCSTNDEYPHYMGIGERMDVMYRMDNPADAYIAKRDLLTGKYLPYEKAGYMMIFLASLLIGFGMVCLSFLLENSRAQALLIGFGLLLMGVMGIFTGIVEGNFKMFWMGLFGAFGLLILFGNGFRSKEKREELENLP